MEYILIIFLQLLGVMLHVGQKLLDLDAKYEDDSFKDIWTTFWKADRITVMISGVIILVHLVCHFILKEYTKIPEAIMYYPLWNFGTGFIFGYAGQRILYKWLGKAEQKLIDKGNNLMGQ